MKYLKNIRKWLTKWKLVDSSKYEITKFPSPTLKFVLTEWQQEQVNKLYKKYGNMDYCFYFTGIGHGFKVKIWKTDKYIDLTDVSNW